MPIESINTGVSRRQWREIDYRFKYQHWKLLGKANKGRVHIKWSWTNKTILKAFDQLNNYSGNTDKWHLDKRG
jgi:hypothetical protein